MSRELKLGNNSVSSFFLWNTAFRLLLEGKRENSSHTLRVFIYDPL